MATQVLPPYLTATTATVTVNGVVQTQIETVLVTSGVYLSLPIISMALIKVSLAMICILLC